MAHAPHQDNSSAIIIIIIIDNSNNNTGNAAIDTNMEHGMDGVDDIPNHAVGRRRILDPALELRPLRLHSCSGIHGISGSEMDHIQIQPTGQRHHQAHAAAMLHGLQDRLPHPFQMLSNDIASPVLLSERKNSSEPVLVMTRSDLPSSSASISTPTSTVGPLSTQRGAGRASRLRLLFQRCVPRINRHSISRQLTRCANRVIALVPGMLASGLCIVAMKTVSPMFIQIGTKDHHGGSDHLIIFSYADVTLASIVSWMATIGICISAVLNGFGSVSMPFTCLTGLFLRPVRLEMINRAESELQSIRMVLQSKRHELNEPSMMRQKSLLNMKNGFAASFSKSPSLRGFADMGDDIYQHKHAKRKEIDFLETLCGEMAEDIEEMKEVYRSASAARTSTGRVKSWIGIAFSIILLFRLYSAGVSMWYQHTANPKEWREHSDDIVTKVLLWFTGHHLVSIKDFSTLSQSLSLGLTIVLGVTQLRTFLRTVVVINRRFSKFYGRCHCMPSADVTPTSAQKLSTNNGGSGSSGTDDNAASNISINVISALLICYCLACIVLTKMMMPIKYSNEFWSAIDSSDPSYTIHDSMVNTIYAIAAMISASMFLIVLAIQRENSIRYNRFGGTAGKEAVYGADAC
eukprot:CAMPEP_0198108192 /NCGR_PEP_ID=MMETSP1442-20131203/276_1 /TAXON_ID= /ORGANISM="Craspedostauros australis, Strain CCMP3328" /LENGTH=631 /DNA_ID=CAMNT_0043763421 /DNA_START=245 /DNA_END=2141 /DNA_ORIENTATION=-